MVVSKHIFENRTLTMKVVAILIGPLLRNKILIAEPMVNKRQPASILLIGV